MARAKRTKTVTKSSESRPFFARHWGSNERRNRTRLWHRLQNAVRIERPHYWWHERSIWQRIGVSLLAILLLSTVVFYTFAQAYIFRRRNEPLVLGTTFIPNYARYLEVDPQETLHAMMYDLGIRRYRFVSYWSNMEKEKGTYDFAELDWQFKMAEESNSDVSLSIGLRQPRWPECHMPEWARNTPKDVWYPELQKFMTAVIERYKDHPNLGSYQLENEFLLTAFGECPDHSRERLIEEFELVKSLDADTPVIITRSNNAVPSWPIGQPRPDVSGAAVYKRVWDKTVTKRYFEYPLPAWYYAFFAGATELTTGRNTILHELQAEPWLPEGYSLKTTSTEEQYETMNPERLKNRIEYGKATGMRTIDLWGAEWWYWRKENRDDPALWNVVKDAVQQTQRTNAYRDGQYIPE